MARIALAHAPQDCWRGALSRVGAAIVLPSTIDVMFLVLAFAIPLSFTARLFGSDGDVGRHIRVGSDILATGGVSFTDHYSYTMAGQPFVPYEWLSEVLFALAHQIGGLAAVAILTGLVIGLTYCLVVVFLRSIGVDPLLALLTGMVSAMLGLLHWLARPHIFSPLGAIALLFVLQPATRRRLWLILPIFALWANLHGGFVYGLVLIGIFLAGDLLEIVVGARARRVSVTDAPMVAERAFWFRRAQNHAIALILAVIGCCINPSGVALFRHVTGFLGDRLLVDRTLEYLSPDFHNPFGQLFLVILLGCFGSLILSSRRPPFAHLILLMVNTAFALYSLRNIPLFAVTALPMVAYAMDRGWRNLRIAERFRSIVANGERDSIPGLWAAAGTVMLLAVAFHHGDFAGITVSSQFDASHFPVAAVAKARASGLSGHIFNEFIWGGYILYAWPEQAVFIDGQTDFYGDAVTRGYLQIAELQDGWRDALRTADVSIVMVPTSSLLARELAREPGWRTWYHDDTAVILTRDVPG